MFLKEENFSDSIIKIMTVPTGFIQEGVSFQTLRKDSEEVPSLKVL